MFVFFVPRILNNEINRGVQTSSEAHQTSSLMGTEFLSPVVERPRRETDHSPPYSHLLLTTTTRCPNIGCLEKSFTILKPYINLFRGQCAKLS
jgi:hypothetical protein